MSSQVLLAFALTFVIHLVSTLAYSVRVVGVRTGRVALSFALFNVLILVSRTANALQAPLLAKDLEQKLLSGGPGDMEKEFRWLLVAATIATAAGALLIPTFQRLFARAVRSFAIHRSVPHLFFRALSVTGVTQALHAVTIPSARNLSALRARPGSPTTILIFNVFAVAFLTTGVFCSLYAGFLDTNLRTTASSLSGVVNGLATILLVIFIDPYLSALTDDVVEQIEDEAFFRHCIVLFVVTRLVGTVFGQLLLVPGAHLVVAVAHRI